MSESKSANGSALRVRRIVAILLVALTMVCLFWPAVISFTGDGRDEIKSYYESWKEYKKSDDFDEEMKSQLETFKDIFGSASDAKAYMNACVASNDSLRPDMSFLNLRTLFSSGFTTHRLTMKANGISYSDLSSGDKETYTGMQVCSIVLNVLFFGTLALGAGAIVLMLLNKSKVLNVILVVFAFLCVAAAVVAIVVFGSDDRPIVYGRRLASAPGVSMFLIPIFALAACILYKRDRYRGASPAPAFAQQPQNNAWGAQQQNNAWNTPQQNDAWGAQPAAEAATWTCPVCGTKNPTTVLFCPNCGTKQD